MERTADKMMGTPNFETSSLDRVAAAQKRSLFHDLAVAVTLVLALVGGGLALESSARALLVSKTTSTVVATPEATEDSLAQVEAEGAVECDESFGETC